MLLTIVFLLAAIQPSPEAVSDPADRHCEKVRNGLPPSKTCGVAFIPFSGRVFRRAPDGTLTPARKAVFSTADGPLLPPLRIDRQGRFSGGLSYSISDITFCKDGKRVSERIIRPVSLTVSAPACTSVSVAMTGAQEPLNIVLACSGQAPRDASPSRPSATPTSLAVPNPGVQWTRFARH